MSDVYDSRAGELIRKHLGSAILPPAIAGKLQATVKGWLQSDPRANMTAEVLADQLLSIYFEGLNDGMSIEKGQPVKAAP